MEKLTFPMELAAAIFCIALCLIIHYGWKNRKYIWENELGLKPLDFTKSGMTMSEKEWFLENGKDEIHEWGLSGDKRTFNQLFEDWKAEQGRVTA